MSPRNRSYAKLTHKGLTQRFGNIEYGHNGLIEDSSGCSDHTGQGDNDPFHVNYGHIHGGRLSRLIWDYWIARFDDYRADALDSIDYWPHLTLPSDIPSSVAAATAGAARTNPSSAIVDVPVALLEFGDVVKQIRDLGRSAVKRTGDLKFQAKNKQVAGHYIGYQFGVAPLVGDLVKILTIQDHINKRVKVIKNFIVRNGMKKTVDIGTWSSTATQYSVFQSYNSFISGMHLATTTQSLRVHCRWLPTVDPSSIAAPDVMRELARRAVKGITVDASTLWEAMPWSWLIDWATNAGQFFKAHRNTVPAVLDSVRVLTHTTTEYSGGPYAGGDGLTMSPFSVKREEKRRATSFVAPIAHFPFLDGRQVGILSSLAVLRA